MTPQRPENHDPQDARTAAVAQHGAPPPRRGGAGRIVSVLVRGVLPVVVLIVGVLGAVALVKTAPQAQQKTPQRIAALVEVAPVAPTAGQVVVNAMGTVIPAEQVVLQPQVSGTIQYVHPALVPGGRIEVGERLIAIDPADYEVALREAQAMLARAEAQRESARIELERIERLRTRQAANQTELDNARTAMQVAEAEVAAAQAAVEKAQIALNRTTMTAPFDSLVIDENVDVGAQVTPQTQLARLVGTDEYWVRATVPVEQLQWIRLPAGPARPGSPVSVRQRLATGEVAEWSGQVVRLLGDLEPQGRMARLLIAVSDPLGEADGASQATPLLIGSYVEAAIQGPELSDIFIIDRDDVHDGNKIWVMNEDSLLEIRPLRIVYGGRDRVFVESGLKAGDKLIVSDLPAPVAGMPLRVLDQDEAVAAAGRTTSAPATSAADGAGGVR